jgi:two-component system OmpR family response regulator
MTKKTVLVVEDERLSQLIIGSTLEQHGIGYLVAQHGKQALKILSENHCDLILTDLRMSVMDGVELIKTLRKQEKATGNTPIPIVVLSAEKDEMIDTALQLGVNDYFVKYLG